MKILNIISAFRAHGGTVSKLRTIVKYSKNNHQVCFYCYPHEYEEAQTYNEFYENIDIKTHYGNWGSNFVKAALDIRKIIKKEKIDIVHYYFNYENLTIMLLKTLCPNVKYIRSFVGYIPLTNARIQILRLALRRTDNYIYISKYIKEKYEESHPLLKKKNSTIIYNCPIYIDKGEIDVAVKDIILYVGAINEHKNVPQLIETMNIVVNEFKRDDIVLQIVGDGKDRKQVEELIAKYNLQKNVILHGAVKGPIEYYRRCKIYLHAATNEGFGISVTEAMFMKCPCIVANTSGLKEVMSEECGYILPYNDPKIWAEKLIYLNDNKEIREEFGENAYKRAKEMFSREKFINAHDQMYEYIYKNGSLKEYNNQ